MYDDEYNDTDEEVSELLQANRRDALLLQVNEDNSESDYSDNDDDDDDGDLPPLWQRGYGSDSDSDDDDDDDDDEGDHEGTCDENMDGTVHNVETAEKKRN